MKKKLKIVQILPSLNSGGVERGTLEIASFLVRNGHDSTVVSQGGRLVDDLVKSGSVHIKMNIGKKSLFTFFLLPFLIKLILNKNFDIIHVRSRFPAWIVFIALKLIPKNKRPFFVTTVHGFNKVSWYSKIMTKGDKVIAVSNFIKSHIIEKYQVDKKKINVIHRGVPKYFSKLNEKNFELWKASWKREFTYLENCKILTIIARVSRTKGIETFIDMVNLLIKRGHNVHGLIVGEAKSLNYYNFLIKKIKNLKIEKYITLTGFRSDVFSIIQYSDLTYCLSDVPEPFGRSVIESIKIGTPVIGYDSGGVGEQLRDIFPEGMIKYQDYDSLFKKTIYFLARSPKIKKTNLYTLEQMQNKTLKVYCSFFK